MMAVRKKNKKLILVQLSLVNAIFFSLNFLTCVWASAGLD